MIFVRPQRNALITTISLSMLTFAHPALAGYTVMDDDLFPTHAIPASVAQAVVAARAQPLATTANTSANAETYSILFRKAIWGLNEEGNNSVLAMVPLLLHANKIVITGRPDTQPNKFLAEQRATNLRTAFIKNGVPESKITTRTENTPTTPINGMSPVDVQVFGIPSAQPVAQAPAVNPAALAAQARLEQAAARTTTTVDNGIRVTTTQAAVAPAATPTVAIIATPAQPAQAAQAQPATPDVRLDLVRQVALASQAGRIDAKAAIATIIEMLYAQPGKPSAATTAAIAPQPTPRPAPGAEFDLVAAAETARPKEWQLSSAKTLRDNVAEWAAKENYTIDWRASNYFKVGTNRTLTGEMFVVVDRVTSAADLDMAVWKQTREIWICDKKTDQCAKKPTQPSPSDARR